jgi:broad specificity phosphatase PhoE
MSTTTTPLQNSKRPLQHRSSDTPSSSARKPPPSQRLRRRPCPERIVGNDVCGCSPLVTMNCKNATPEKEKDETPCSTSLSSLTESQRIVSQMSPSSSNTTRRIRLPSPSFLSSSSSSKSTPHKTIYLIRHGESIAQKKPRQQRQNDSSLIDCGLSALGVWQAREMIPQLLGQADYDSIELVITSPLTRALQTSVLAFPDKPILCHYHLREIGSMIPENIPRPMKQVLMDLQQHLGAIPVDHSRIDVETLRPEQWPKRHDTPPKVIRRDHVRAVFQWIAQHRPEQTIAVVCHYHVIMAALAEPPHTIRTTPKTNRKKTTTSRAATATTISPENATPIKCYLDPETGRLSLAKNVVNTNVN